MRPPAWYVDREIERCETELAALADTLEALRDLRGATRYHLDVAESSPRRSPAKRGPKPGTIRKPIDHGTNAGYTMHRRRDEIPCDACYQAHADYVADRDQPPVGTTDPALSEPVLCPHCGSEMRRGGYVAHRNRKHPGSNANPLDPVPDKPCPPSQRPTVYGAEFACDCGERFDQLAQLIAHVIGKHRRRPTADERTPRPIEARAS